MGICYPPSAKFILGFYDAFFILFDVFTLTREPWINGSDKGIFSGATKPLNRNLHAKKLALWIMSDLRLNLSEFYNQKSALHSNFTYEANKALIISPLFRISSIHFLDNSLFSSQSFRSNKISILQNNGL